MTASTTTASASASLAHLLAGKASASDISSYLDGLSGAARLDEVLSITGSGVGRLFDACADAEPTLLEEFFPANTQGTMIYEGRNSLFAFSRFQKRFTRAPSGTIIGYNHQSMSFVTGPGYFVVKAPSGSGEHAKELLFDYTEVPGHEPAGWPTYKANDKGLSTLVYANMHDYCRRVARGVVVGKAYKLGIDQKQFFTLTLP